MVVIKVEINVLDDGVLEVLLGDDYLSIYGLTVKKIKENVDLFQGIMQPVVQDVLDRLGLKGEYVFNVGLDLNGVDSGYLYLFIRYNEIDIPYFSIEDVKKKKPKSLGYYVFAIFDFENVIALMKVLNSRGITGGKLYSKDGVYHVFFELSDENEENDLLLMVLEEFGVRSRIYDDWDCLVEDDVVRFICERF